MSGVAVFVVVGPMGAIVGVVTVLTVLTLLTVVSLFGAAALGFVLGVMMIFHGVCPRRRSSAAKTYTDYAEKLKTVMFTRSPGVFLGIAGARLA